MNHLHIHKYRNVLQNTGSLPSLFVYPCSPVQEHGSWRAVPALQALLASGAGEGAEGRLAEEAAEYHEKLAAALVRPEDRSSVLLQRPG